MTKEQFEKARPIIDSIENVSELLNINKIENKSDDYGMHGSRLLHIKQKNINSNVRAGDGYYDQDIYAISEFKDGSGAKINLNTYEVLKLSNCIREILEERLISNKKELDSI